MESNRYEILQAKAGFRRGQIVTVLRAPTEEEIEERGWPNTWVEEMDELIDKRGLITKVAWNGVEVNGEFLLPFWVLRGEGH